MALANWRISLFQMKTYSESRVALIVWCHAWGGTEKHTCYLADTLASRGHDVTIVCLQASTYHLYQQHAPSHLKLALCETTKNCQLMGIHDWRALHVQIDATMAIFVKGCYEMGSWAGDLSARLRFRKYLTIEHLAGEPFPKKRSRLHFGIVPGLGLWWYGIVCRAIIRSWAPHGIFCVSDAVRDRLVEDYGVAVGKAATVHNGTDLQRFKPDASFRAAFREELGIPTDSIVLGSVGRLAKVKNLALAVQAFHALKKQSQRSDVYLILVGEGECEPDLRELIDAFELNESVRLVPFTERPWEVYPGIDVFLLPSRNEGLPFSLLEAMACGCCPIATDVGGNGELLKSEAYGWLVPRGDDQAFIEAVLCCLSETGDQIRERGEKARQRVQEDFCIERQMLRLCEAIEVHCVPNQAQRFEAVP